MEQTASQVTKGEPQNQSLIVLVDDDELIRNSTARLLRSKGFRFESFPSAEEFIGSGRMGGTACLLLDVRMPGMGGLELQGLLATRGFRFPIIFVTANGNEQIERQALQAGASAFLHKPVPQDTLLRAIRNALQLPNNKGMT
jgi:FixJ family two-component response regulator